MLNSLKVALVEFANGKYQTILCPFTFTKFANPYYAPEETWSSLRNASRIHPNPGPLAPGLRGTRRRPHHLPSLRYLRLFNLKFLSL